MEWAEAEGTNTYQTGSDSDRAKIRAGWERDFSTDYPEPVKSAIEQKPQVSVDEDSPDFIPGIQRGLQNLQAMTYGAGALAGSGLKKLGAESVGQSLQDIGMEGYRRNIEEAKQYPKKHSFKDIYTGKTGVGGAIDWAQGTLGELVPSMVEAAGGAAIGAAIGSTVPVAGTGAGAIAGAFAGRTVLKKGIEKIVQQAMKKGVGKLTEAEVRKQATRQALKKLGGKAGIAGAVMPMESGGMYADLLEEKGIDAPETALLFGALATSLEFFGGNSKLVDIFVDALSSGAAGIVKKSAKEILTNIPQEALQEGGQELFGILNTVANTDEKLLTAEHVEQIIESMAAGAVGGGAGAVMQAGMPGQGLEQGPEKTPQEIELDRRATNILTQDKEQVNQSIQKLNEYIKSNQELLSDYQKLDARAIELNIEPTALIDQILADNNSNQSLIDKINTGITEQGKLKQEEYEQLSPEDKAVKDVADKLDAQRAADAQKINADIKTIDDQLALATKQYQQEKDPEKKKVIVDRVFALRKEKNTLLDNQQVQQDTQAKEFAAPKKADEIRQEKEDFYTQLWPGGVSKDAAESAQVFESNAAQQEEILQQILQEKDLQKRQELQDTYNQMFQTFERDVQESARTFEYQDLSSFDKATQQRIKDAQAGSLTRTDPEKLAQAVGKPEQIATLNQMGITDPDGQVQQIVNDAVTQKVNVAEMLEAKGRTEEAAVFRAQAEENGNKLKAADGVQTEQAVDIALQGTQVEDTDSSFTDEQQGDKASQFQVAVDQEAISKVNLADIEKAFLGQNVTQDTDGTISVQFKNGKGVSIKSIQDAGEGFIKLAIETGQMSKDGKILGITVGNEILLDDNFADNKTLWHENKHVLDNLGMITAADNSALNKEFNKLRKQNKLDFALSTHEDPKQQMVENRANMFAQIMVNRETYRDTSFGKVIQRVMDFFQQMLAMGKQSISGLAREVESGKIYERQADGQITASENIPEFQFENIPISQQVLGGLINKKTATDTKAFKDWFGQSVTKNTQGDPIIFYHGTDEVFEEFTKDAPKISRHLSADLGHFFTMQKGLAEKYGQHQVEAYLKLERPYKMPLTESQSFETFGESEQFKADLQKQGYDSIIITTGTSPYIIIFESGQAKSIHNQGDWSDKKNIYFEVREAPEQKIPQADYDALHAEKNNILRNMAQQARIKLTDARLLADKALGPISTRLGLVDKELPAHMRQLDFDTTQRIIDALTPANEILDITHGKKNKLGIRQGGMSAVDKDEWNWARLQSDKGKIEQIAQKYNMTEHLAALREKLNQLRNDAIKVGYDVGFIDEYWPRAIKDREGFLQATEGVSQDPIFTQAFREQAKKLGITQEAFERDFPDIKADIISNLILGQTTGIGGPGNIQSRVFETIPKEYAQFYMDADASLMQYVYSMSKKIEARKFFGKVPQRISGLKAAKKRKQADLIKYKQLADMARTENPEALVEYEKKIDDLNEDIVRIDEPLNIYKIQNDYTENIGTYITDMMTAGRIGKKDEKMVRDILNARFNEQGTHGIINAVKNAAYIDVMGSPLSAITQIGDLAWAMYVGKVWTPKGFSDTAKNLSKAILNRSNITKEVLGFERIAQEFSDNTTLGKGVSKVFKLVGLEKIDSIGKEVLINNALDQFKAQAKANPEALAKLIRPTFRNKSIDVVQELLAYDPTNINSKPSDNIKMLLYSKVLDFQPVALSEMPELYLNSGNGRVFYMLKTYTMKQFDVFRREVFHNIKSENPQQKIQGIKNMVQLVALLTLANATADEIKDFMLGKETRFSDNVIENFLSLGGASRYLKMKISRDGIGTALSQQILPPMKFINSASKDAFEGYKNYVSGDTSSFDHARIIDSIPGVGKLYYWHFGRGDENKKSLAENDFKKDTKDARLFKKQLENSDDKRLFIESNFDRFKKMKLQENFQSALSRNKAVINKLEKIPSTENVQTRLGQLKAQREQILERYFDVAEGMI